MEKYPCFNRRILDGLHSLFVLLGVIPSDNLDEEDDFNILSMVAMRHTDIDAFEAFCVLCMKHAVGNTTSRKNYRRDIVSGYVTLCNEAFCFLILENHREYWREYFCTENMEENKVAVKTKYTVRGSMGGVKGWHADGIKVFNRLLKEVKLERNNPRSADIERELKRKWNVDMNNQLSMNGRLVISNRIEVAEEEEEPDLPDF